MTQLMLVSTFSLQPLPGSADQIMFWLIPLNVRRVIFPEVHPQNTIDYYCIELHCQLLLHSNAWPKGWRSHLKSLFSHRNKRTATATWICSFFKGNLYGARLTLNLVHRQFCLIFSTFHVCPCYCFCCSCCWQYLQKDSSLSLNGKEVTLTLASEEDYKNCLSVCLV